MGEIDLVTFLKNEQYNQESKECDISNIKGSNNERVETTINPTGKLDYYDVRNTNDFNMLDNE